MPRLPRRYTCAMLLVAVLTAAGCSAETPRAAADVTAVGFHAAVGTCVAREIRKLRFPALRQEKIQVNYPFIFSPDK